VVNDSPEERPFNLNDAWDVPSHPNWPQLDYFQNNHTGYHSTGLNPASTAYPSPDEFPLANLPASEQAIHADGAYNYISLDFIGPPEGSPKTVARDLEDYSVLQEYLSNHSSPP
jgi:hypothetical protein